MSTRERVKDCLLSGKMKPSLRGLVSIVYKGRWFGLCFALGLWLLGCVIWQTRDSKGTSNVVFYCSTCIFYTGISISLDLVIPGSSPQIERFLPAANKFCNPQSSLTPSRIRESEKPLFHMLFMSSVWYFLKILLSCARLPLFTATLSHLPSLYVSPRGPYSNGNVNKTIW